MCGGEDMHEKEFSHKAFINREYSIVHTPFEKEFEFYNYVKTGDTENVRRTMTPLGSGNAGKLSDDPLRNLRYHFVVTVALVTRFCIEGGMEPEKAYTMSDMYIHKCDRACSENEIHELHREAVLGFTKHMNGVLKKNVYSKPVILAMDYIYDNLHSRITVEEIARHTDLSVSYISRLFHSSTGLTITEYIMKKRVEAAENMLRYSDKPSAEIGNYLAFSSHSHFISIFKKHTGLTPEQYRRKYFRTSALQEDDS